MSGILSINHLIENVFQKEKRDKTEQSRSQRRGYPAERNAPQKRPVQISAAFGQPDADNGADNGLRTGDRNQRQRRQSVFNKKVFQPLGSEEIEDNGL